MELTKNAQPTRAPGVKVTKVEWEPADVGKLYLAVSRHGQWLFRVAQVDERRGVKYQTLAGNGFPERGSGGWVPGMSMDPDADSGLDGWEFSFYAVLHYTWQNPIRELTDADADEVAAGIKDAAEHEEWFRTAVTERHELGNFIGGDVPRLLHHPGIGEPARKAAVEKTLRDIGHRKVRPASAGYWLDVAIRESATPGDPTPKA